MLHARNAARKMALRVPPLRRLVESRAELLQTSQVLAQTISDLQAERDSVRAELDAIRVERDSLLMMKERASPPSTNKHDERVAARLVAEALESERDRLSSELDRLSREREIVERERQGLQAELNRVRSSLEVNTFGIIEFLRDRIAPQMAALLTSQELTASRIIRAVETNNGSSSSSSRSNTSKYIDLLELTLTGMIYGDAPIDPGTSGIFDPAIRAIGRDWPSQAHTMIGRTRLRNLRGLCERVIEEGIPGDLIETGVWRGGACILMKGILEAYGDRVRRVFVADSFQGLPPPDVDKYQADEGDIHHTFGQLMVSRQEVEENFRRYGLLDERVCFLEGWFKDTLPTAPIERLSLLRLDGDMYESTIQALDALYFKVSPGGFVIVDDYVLKPCAQAIQDFREKHGITAQMFNVDDAAVWWQV